MHLRVEPFAFSRYHDVKVALIKINELFLHIIANLTFSCLQNPYSKNNLVPASQKALSQFEKIVHENRAPYIHNNQLEYNHTNPKLSALA
jgi:hypothetical protein